MTDDDAPDEGATTRHGDAGLEYCAHCGARLPDDVWCPVHTVTDPDGSIRFRSFCDADCESAWDGDDR